MGRKAIVAACTLSQWALDFQGNMERILESIDRAKEAGARYRCGPELDITGYSCGDHYHESDTQLHAWQVLAQLLVHPSCSDIIVDVGLPVTHKDVVYNCKLVFLNGKILLIRPKMILADDACAGYNETRWFTPWNKTRQVEPHPLPAAITQITGQTEAPFGDALVATRDTCVGFEICEELYNPESPHIQQLLDGAEIISNGLGAWEELGRPEMACQLISSATAKGGGCYLFANQRGYDGSLGYYPGEAYIALNGSVISRASPYSLLEVEVAVAEVDLELVRRQKALIRSRCTHASKVESYPRVKADFWLCSDANEEEGAIFTPLPPFPAPLAIAQPSPAEQILQGPACWLWDFFRRSGRRGILISIDGEVDSSLTAAIVYHMCHLVVGAVTTGDEKVLQDIRRILGQTDYTPQSARELNGKVTHTLCLHGRRVNAEAAKRAAALAQDIGSIHRDYDLDKVVKEMTASLRKSEGDEEALSDVTLQHLLSRLQMSFAFLYAEVAKRDSDDLKPGQSNDLLVLTSADLDLVSRGSFAKYGHVTSGDLNLIGRFPRSEVKEALRLAKERHSLPSLGEVLAELPRSAKRTTEAVPQGAMDDEEMAQCRALQGGEGCGPYSLFGKLVYGWSGRYSPEEIAERVKSYFRHYSLQQHKLLALAPSYYVPGTGPMNEARPIFSSPAWTWQFKAVDNAVNKMKENKEKKK